MRIAVTGATGLVGYPIAKYLIERGHQVTTLGRRALPGIPNIRWDLAGPSPDLYGQEHLVHAAFSHIQGRYRGGEGDDPDGFIAMNLSGTLQLWDAARKADVHAIFISSRAVFDGYPPGTVLAEDLRPRPASLYGKVKSDAEAALGDTGASIRATGVFGPPVPGRRHKWSDLFEKFRKGENITPGIGTEIHSRDLASAVEIAAELRLCSISLNASGFILDRAELLEIYRDVSGVRGELPAKCDPAIVSVLGTDRLRRLGWSPSGTETLSEVVRSLIGQDLR